MGHRALVAYERPDGGYDCHRSQWGGHRLQLRGELTPATPYGSPVDDPPVDPAPVRTVGSPSELASAFDYLGFEALYVVAEGFAVRAYLPLWFGLLVRRAESADSTDGVLVSVENAADARRLRRRFRALKTRLAENVERDDCDRRAARHRLRRWARAVAVDRDVLGREWPALEPGDESF